MFGALKCPHISSIRVKFLPSLFTLVGETIFSPLFSSLNQTSDDIIIPKKVKDDLILFTATYTNYFGALDS